jgi:outer membrane receptor protein involved in Fe transport
VGAFVWLWSGRAVAGPGVTEPEPESAPAEQNHETQDDETREIVVRTPTQTASATTISADDIATIPIRSAEDSLRLAPGLVLVQHGAEGKGQQYFLRGFDAVHGLDFEVEVEGMPINEWSNIHAQGYLDLGMLIPETIAGVEVLPGSFVLDQGPFALAGSARFSLGIGPGDRGVRGRVELGSTLRARTLVSYSPRGGDGSRFIAADLMTDRGFGESRDSRRAVVMLRQHLYDGRRSRVSALLIGQVAEFGLPGTTSAREYEAGRIGFWGAHDNGRGEAQRAAVALDWTLTRARQRLRLLTWSGYRRLELLENFTGFLERPEQGDRRVQRHRGIPFGLRVDHRVLLGRRVELQTGLGVRGDVFEQSEQRVDLEQRPFETTRAAAAVQADIWALAGVRLALAPTLELGTGARVDLIAISADDRSGEADASGGGGLLVAASPKAHVRWAALERLDLFLAYGRSFRPPEARAFTSFDAERMGLSDDLADDGTDGADERPRISTADGGELGLRWRPDPRVALQLIGFATYVARESIYDHVSRTNLQLSATRRFGTELRIDTRPLPWLGFTGNVTWVDARFVESRNPVPLAPSLVGSLHAWLAHRLGARAGLLLVGWAPRPLPYGARGSGLVRVDATFGWQHQRVRVDVAIENLLGLRLREGEYSFASNFRPGQPASQLPTLHFVPGPPLTARVGLTLLW